MVYYFRKTNKRLDVLLEKGKIKDFKNIILSQKEKHEEKGFTEKHRPVVNEEDDGATIKIGSIPHPMLEEHYIEWVEVITEGKICRYLLSLI